MHVPLLRTRESMTVPERSKRKAHASLACECEYFRVNSWLSVAINLAGPVSCVASSDRAPSLPSPLRGERGDSRAVAAIRIYWHYGGRESAFLSVAAPSGSET